MANRVLVEIVCCTVEDAVAATEGGADRIELVAALEVGGVTPSLGTLRAVKAHTSLPVMAMVRPRASGFCYSRTDQEVMMEDAALLLENGADGIVFGSLHVDGRIDEPLTRRLVSLARGKHTVFHRAFDAVPDPFAALETLIACGVTRLLSAGQAQAAQEGASLLRRLQEQAAGQIEVMPGGGIRAHNARAIVAETGIRQIHLAPRVPRHDPSAAHYGDDGRVTAELVAAVVAALREGD